jgi:amino-acid N-acetyltransferase
LLRGEWTELRCGLQTHGREAPQAGSEGGLNRAASALQISARPALRVAVALLEPAGLPATDLTEAHLEHFFYCGPNESPTGLIGLEIYDTNALLRSLLVAGPARGAGLGSALVRYAENYARSQGVRAMYLLTTTAERFFAQMGYARIARGAVVPAIQGTREFRELCPESSALMAKALYKGLGTI